MHTCAHMHLDIHFLKKIQIYRWAITPDSALLKGLSNFNISCTRKHKKTSLPILFKVIYYFTISINGIAII